MSKASQKKQTATDSEPEESSASNVNVQKEKQKSHTFVFSISNGNENIVEYDTSKTVFGALNTHEKFISCDKEGKEIIIRRSKGKISEAVVKTDFPCCLIEDDENMKINLYGSKIASTNQETTTDTDPQNLVTFYIRTRGKKIKKIMKSTVFGSQNHDYVCVFARKGDFLKEALQHDGRFIDNIFDNGSELIDDNGKSYAMNVTVDHCDGKKFDLNVNSAGKKPKKSAKNNGKTNNTEQKTMQELKKEVTDPSTEDHAAQNTAGNSGDLSGDSGNSGDLSGDSGNSGDLSGDSGNSFSADIKKILETLCEYVLKELEQQTNPQVQKFIQEEYDKGIECFTEVKKVREIIELSDSVCLIKVENSARGTGFLFFDRFILTNAHVVQDYVYSPTEDPHTFKFSRNLTAEFNHEALRYKTEDLPVKCDLVAYKYKKDENLMCHDYALLELDKKPENCIELLKCYKHAPTPNRGGIYIVGHPNCGVKKMDPCFIIGIEKQLQSINKHISENISCPYVAWQCWPHLCKNQITYNSCLFHGSSGSPVFDEHCYLIGMHSGGFHYEGQKDRSVIEFAYSMQPILESIVTQVKNSERFDILNSLSKFESVKKKYNLGNTEDTSGANMPITEEQQSEEIEEMETN